MKLTHSPAPVLQEADTDDNQGTLGFEEFCSFYKMMSTRRDLYLLMLTYSNHKDHLDADDLTRFLEIEQKVLTLFKITQVAKQIGLFRVTKADLEPWRFLCFWFFQVHVFGMLHIKLFCFTLQVSIPRYQLDLMCRFGGRLIRYTSGPQPF